MDIHAHPMPTLLLGGDGTIQDANAAAGSLMGMLPEDLRGAVMERVFLGVEQGPSPERFLGDLLTRGQGRFDGVVMGRNLRQRVTAWGWRPVPKQPSFWVHLIPAPPPRPVAAPAAAPVAPVAAAPAAPVPDALSHLPAPFKKLLESPARAEAVLRLGGAMGTHARELLSALVRLAQVLRGQTAAQPHLAAFSHVAWALSQDAEKLAELTGTAGELAPEAVDLTALLETTHILLQGALPPDIHVAVEVDQATPAAWANPLALQQAILALVQSARDGMPVGGNILVAALPGQQDGMMELQVRDSGPPRPGPEDDPGDRVLERRRSMDVALPLVRELMDRMGGQVAVQSSGSAGTCVVLTVPARAPVAPVTPSRPRVLVVDDDAQLRRVTARMLEQSGMETRTAVDGADALAQLAQEETTFGVILLDLNMPRADGHDVLRFVQLMPQAPAVVVFTADDPNAVKDDVLALGAYAVMGKPFLGRELINTIRAALRSRTS